MITVNSLVVIRTDVHFLFGVVVGINYRGNFRVEIYSLGDYEDSPRYYEGNEIDCDTKDLVFIRQTQDGEKITIETVLEEVFHTLRQHDHKESLALLMAT